MEVKQLAPFTIAGRNEKEHGKGERKEKPSGMWVRVICGDEDLQHTKLGRTHNPDPFSTT
jgi:hypothetical protein